MKPIKARIVRALPVGAYLNVADNSGAKVVKLIAVIGYKGRKRRLAKAGIADLVIVSVRDGKPDMVGQLYKAVIVRMKKEWARPDGTRIKFEDNAVALLKDEYGTPKGTIIKTPIAKEVAERWPEVAKIARIVV